MSFKVILINRLGVINYLFYILLIVLLAYYNFRGYIIFGESKALKFIIKLYIA